MKSPDGVVVLQRPEAQIRSTFDVRISSSARIRHPSPAVQGDGGSYMCVYIHIYIIIYIYVR